MGTSQIPKESTIPTAELTDQAVTPVYSVLDVGQRTRAARPRVRAAPRGLLLPVCDVVALGVASLAIGLGWAFAIYSSAVFIALNAFGRHRLRICMRVSDEVPRIAVAALLPLVLLSPWIDSLSRLLRLVVLTAAVLVAMRAVVYASLRVAYRARWLAEPVLIVGTGELGLEVGALLREHPDLGLELVGHVGDEIADSDPSIPLLADLSRVCDVVGTEKPTKIIVALPPESCDAIVSTLSGQCSSSIDLYVVPALNEMATTVPKEFMDEIWGIPLLPVRRSPLRSSGRIAKRAFDLLIGSILLLIFGPMLLVLMAAVWCRGRRVMFRQERVTRSGRIMNIMKLRTISCADPDSQWTVREEDCSSLGLWLRATHLDELPQLLNIIRGDMSLVGPRPERPYFTARFADSIPRYDDRHRVCGGLTGWAQVHGLTADTSIPERTRFDNYYIEHWSLWLDVVILVRTITEPFTGALRAVRARERR